MCVCVFLFCFFCCCFFFLFFFFFFFFCFFFLLLLLQSTLFIPTLDTTTKFVIMTIWKSRNPRSRGDSYWEIMQEYYIKISSNICFGYLLESPYWGDSNKYTKHIFYEEIRIKQGPSYISFCPLRILYNSKIILIATPLGTNAVVVTRVHCISDKPLLHQWTCPNSRTEESTSETQWWKC